MKILATEGATRFIPIGEIWVKAWNAFRIEAKIMGLSELAHFPGWMTTNRSNSSSRDWRATIFSRKLRGWGAGDAGNEVSPSGFCFWRGKGGNFSVRGIIDQGICWEEAVVLRLQLQLLCRVHLVASTAAPDPGVLWCTGCKCRRCCGSRSPVCRASNAAFATVRVARASWGEVFGFGDFVAWGFAGINGTRGFGSRDQQICISGLVVGRPGGDDGAAWGPRRLNDCPWVGESHSGSILLLAWIVPLLLVPMPCTELWNSPMSKMASRTRGAALIVDSFSLAIFLVFVFSLLFSDFESILPILF